MRALGVIACLIVAGCSSPPTPVALTDSGVFVPSARLAFDIGRDKPERPAVPHDGVAIELGLSRGTPSGEQALQAGESPVRLGRETFNAPQQLRADFDFKFFEAAFRYRNFPHAGRFGFDLLAGLGVVKASMALASATQSAKGNFDSNGFLVGGGLLWRLAPSTSAQARASGYVSINSQRVSQAGTIDLSLAQALTKHIAIRAGYAFWTFSAERGTLDLDNNSAIRTRFSGPAAALEATF